MTQREQMYCNGEWKYFNGSNGSAQSDGFTTTDQLTTQEMTLESREDGHSINVVFAVTLLTVWVHLQ